MPSNYEDQLGAVGAKMAPSSEDISESEAVPAAEASSGTDERWQEVQMLVDESMQAAQSGEPFEDVIRDLCSQLEAMAGGYGEQPPVA